MERLAAEIAAVKNPRLSPALARAITRRRLMESKGMGGCEWCTHGHVCLPPARAHTRGRALFC